MRIGPATAAALAVLATFASPAPGAPSPAFDEPGPGKIGCRPFTSGAERTSSTCGAAVVDGRAVPPAGAPPEVRTAIEAANRIAHTPYVWGGGHLGWSAKGYDCSGAVGYALHGAGMLDRTMVSGELETWGEGGTGRWITVYANRHHAYMLIAGLRFDTRDGLTAKTGPRWHTDMPRDPTRRFTARHLARL